MCISRKLFCSYFPRNMVKKDEPKDLLKLGFKMLKIAGIHPHVLGKSKFVQGFQKFMLFVYAILVALILHQLFFSKADLRTVVKNLEALGGVGQVSSIFSINFCHISENIPLKLFTLL